MQFFEIDMVNSEIYGHTESDLVAHVKARKNVTVKYFIVLAFTVNYSFLSCCNRQIAVCGKPYK